MSDIFHTMASGVGLTVLDRTGTYDYEWSEFAVMRGTDGKLYVGATGGCSCNSFEENLDDDDIMQVKSWQDAATQATRWASGQDVDGSETHFGSGPYLEDEKRAGMDLVERLAKARPAAVEAVAR